MVPFVRNPYNYDVREASKEVALVCADASKTQQNFKQECDINHIMKKFGKTGVFPTPTKLPTYADFSEIGDFHSAMNAVAAAHEAFEAIPAEIRAKFNNDPGAFVDFCSREENKEALVEMGLAKAPKAPPVAFAPPGGVTPGGAGEVPPPAPPEPPVGS